MRQCGLKDSRVRRVTICYAYDLFPDHNHYRTFNSQKDYYDWTMSSDAQRCHIKELTMVLVPDCKFHTLF